MANTELEELGDEIIKNEMLLHQLLPSKVARILKQGKPVIPEHFNNVSIFFSDVVGFTQISDRVGAVEVFKLLNELYSGITFL